MVSPAELMAQRLAWEFESRKFVKVRVQTDILSHQADPKGNPLQDFLG